VDSITFISIFFKIGLSSLPPDHDATDCGVHWPHYRLSEQLDDIDSS